MDSSSSPPGSPWLSLQLHFSGLEPVLWAFTQPLADAVASGAARRWFFSRGPDQPSSLRVNLFGSPRRLWEETLPSFQEAASPLLKDGRLFGLEVVPYQRDLPGWGGAEGVELAEVLSSIDSRAVWTVLKMVSGTPGAGLFRIALNGLDALLGDLGWDPARKQAVVQRALQRFGKSAPQQTEEGGRELLAPALEAFRRRSEELAPVIRELRERSEAGRLTSSLEELSASFLHQHANRLLGANPLEPQLYGLLIQMYGSKRVG